jgi:hypothetical protein
MPAGAVVVQYITPAIAAAQRGYVGYLGPLSASCLKAGKKPVFDGIAAAKTPAEKSAVSGITRGAGLAGLLLSQHSPGAVAVARRDSACACL